MPKGKKREKKRKKGERLNADLRFSGGKFEGAGFPLDSIDELETYQNLVYEAARQLWHEEHGPGRVPNTLRDQVRLRLVDVKPGSVIPVIQAETTLAIPGTHSILERSIDQVDEIFAQIVGNRTLPPGVSSKATQGYKAFGATLGKKEAVTFRASGRKPVRFTNEDHHAFIKALNDLNFTRSGNLIGVLRVLDSAQALTLQDGAGRKIEGSFSAPEVWDELHDLHNRQQDADLIWIACTYAISEIDGSILRIKDVSQAGLFAKSSDPWSAPLAEFAALPEGWNEGEGAHRPAAARASA